MRKHILLITALLTGASAWAGYTEGYYDSMDGKQRETLKAAVKQCVQNHTRLVYSQLPGYWQYTDVYPELIDGSKRWWDMYSDEVELIRENQSAFQSFSSYGMQREHSVPKSWWKLNGDVEYTPAYTDLWNLYPSNGRANQAKLNYPFGPTNGNNTFNNGCSKVGYPKNGYGGGSSRVFEPADEYKGDFARSMFYMACVYDDINWVINYMYRKDSYPTLVPWACNMLLQWARQDPVSQKEIDRNNLAEQYQGNRNPFVDFPELAEYIWGVRTSEVFRIAEQEGSDPTPPITGDPVLTKPVNGESLDFGQTATGHAVTRALQIEGANFTESLSLRIVGADKSYFKTETALIPASTLNANGGYLLNIIYLPEQVGKHEARITLYDGGLEGSVAVNMTGEALAVPDMKPLRALPATEVREESYVANWEAPAGVADYFTVTRVRYNGDNQEAETYETGETSMRIENRDPSVAESYTVTYSRLGLTSPDSNSIYVAADSGVGALEYELPYRVYPTEQGLIILTDGERVRNLTVCDPSGRVIMILDAEDGTEIALTTGIYILNAPGHRPHKVVIR